MCKGGVKSAFWSKRGPMVAPHYRPGIRGGYSKKVYIRSRWVRVRNSEATSSSGMKIHGMNG